MIYILLRYDNPDGSSKDWSAEVENGGVRVRWGKTGRVNQSTFHPPGKFGPAKHAIIALAEAKKRKGYYEVTRAEEVPDFSNRSASKPESHPKTKTAAALAEWTGSESGLSWF